MIRYTTYPSIYTIDHFRPVAESWDDLVARFQTHTVVDQKDRAPGFGPYVLTPPESPCHAHRDGVRAAAHRCDVCVAALTMAVFDVDEGTQAQLDATTAALRRAAVTHLVYSSWSHAAGKDAYRLVIPFTQPVPSEKWAGTRRALIARFNIRASLEKCSGASHFYYAPSWSGSGRPPVFQTHAGMALDPTPFVPRVATPPRRVPGRRYAEWSEPPEPDASQPVNLAPYRAALARRVATLARATDPDRRRKGVWLRRALDGVALDEHGSRTVALLRTTAVMVWTLPARTPRRVLELLITPSLRAMQAAGSALTDEDLCDMLLPAMRDHDLRMAEDAAIAEAALTGARARRAAVPKRSDLQQTQHQEEGT